MFNNTPYTMHSIRPIVNLTVFPDVFVADARIRFSENNMLVQMSTFICIQIYVSWVRVYCTVQLPLPLLHFWGPGGGGGGGGEGIK